ncbi:hypothetical protein JKI95_04765 [Corynebacterium aquatimens]|nr:hypothetical protein JKI95_04765 [Corynebacterium aquatimens]
MVATSAYHVVRVTVRVSVVTLHRDIDVTLPTSSTLAEVLPELARLIDIPEIHRPWVASTAAGMPLDMHTPLHRLKLADGSIITLSPWSSRNRRLCVRPQNRCGRSPAPPARYAAWIRPPALSAPQVLELWRMRSPRYLLP